MKGIKDWWQKRKDKKAAKKQAKQQAKVAQQQQQGPGVYKGDNLVNDPTPLGNDTANRVYKTETKDEWVQPGSETGGYFKPDQSMAPAKNAVGASKLAQAIGMDDIIPDTRYAKLKTGFGKGGTEIGALSKKVEGEALSENIYDTDITERMRREDGSLPEQKDMSDLKRRKGDKVMEMSGTEYNDMDLSRPVTQAGLNRLQWFDALIGNIDRHSGNILVDPESGQVSGIDNDLSFGSRVKSGDKDRFEKGDGGKYIGLPDLVDEETSEKLLGLDRDKLQALLGQTSRDEAKLGRPDITDFSDEEIEETYKRLEKIKERILHLHESGGLVKQWDQSTYDRQLQKPSHGLDTRKRELYTGYLARQHQNVEIAKDTSKDWEWRKGHRQEDTTPAPQGTPDNDLDNEEKAPVSPPPLDQERKEGNTPSNDQSEPEPEERKEVEQLIGEPLSTEEALAYIDEMIAEFESLTKAQLDTDTTDEQDAPPEVEEKQGGNQQLSGPPSRPLPPVPPRPSVPNSPTVGFNEVTDEEKERKKRFRQAMDKFVNV